MYAGIEFLMANVYSRKTGDNFGYLKFLKYKMP